MCKKALDAFPGAMDFQYFLAIVHTRKGDVEKAWELLKCNEKRLVSGTYDDDSILIPADPSILFSQMILTAKAMDDIENVVLYSTHILTMDKTRLSVLGPCIATMLHYNVPEKDVIDLLSNIYDFRNNDDRQLVIQAAVNNGATDFADKIRKL